MCSTDPISEGIAKARLFLRTNTNVFFIELHGLLYSVQSKVGETLSRNVIKPHYLIPQLPK